MNARIILVILTLAFLQILDTEMPVMGGKKCKG